MPVFIILFGALFGALYAVLAYFLIAKYVYPPFDRAVGQKVDAFFVKKLQKKRLYRGRRKQIIQQLS